MKNNHAELSIIIALLHVFVIVAVVFACLSHHVIKEAIQAEKGIPCNGIYWLGVRG